MTNSDQSLSVVLPVYNAQNRLPHLISQMLEILPDVAAEFEVLVVDDGSTDQTEEVARELAIRYPQVRVARHTERRGGDAVIQTGYELTQGKVVIVQQENTAFGHADLQRLWQLHAAQEAQPEFQPTRLDSATEDYLTAWSAAFAEKMKRPSRAELEAMVADLDDAEVLPDDPERDAGGGHLRKDPGVQAEPSWSRPWGPPRVRTARR